MLDKDFSKLVTLKDGSVVTLRFPNSNDIETIRQSVNEIIREDTYFLVREEVTYEGEVEFLTPQFKAIAENRGFMIYAFSGSKVLGWISADEISPRSAHARMLGIALIQEGRGKGLGEILMRKGMELAKAELDCELFILQVAEENIRARNLYKKLGFVEAGMVPGQAEYKGQRMGEITMYRPA